MAIFMDEIGFSFRDPKTKDPEKRRVQRGVEMVPGFVGDALWDVCYLFFCRLAAVIIILFDLYWLYRIVFISFYF